MLAGVDTLVFDIQDIGTRFYTYISTLGLAMEAAAERGLRFVVLDRPNPINGIDVSGPVADPGRESFTAFHRLPVRHGMTAGELGADYISFGPVGQTGLGTGAVVEPELFEWWSQMIEVPVVAEGALTVELIEKFGPVTDFFGIGTEIWAADNASAALKALLAPLG